MSKALNCSKAVGNSGTFYYLEAITVIKCVGYICMCFLKKCGSNHIKYVKVTFSFTYAPPFMGTAASVLWKTSCHLKLISLI